MPKQPRDKTTCKHCNKQYTRKHTCPHGQCTKCGEHFKYLKRHICPVENLEKIDVSAIVENARMSTFICEVCRVQHFTNKLRVFKNICICRDCYTIPEVFAERRHLGNLLILDDVQKGKTNCKLCQKQLIDPQTNTRLCNIERDHVDVFEKQDNVGTMVMQGKRLQDIIRENDKCRSLCVACHSAVTFVEWKVGIYGLKKYNNKHVQKVASNTVEDIVQLLV